MLCHAMLCSVRMYFNTSFEDLRPQVDWDHMDQAQAPKIVSSRGARSKKRLEMVGVSFEEITP